MTPPWSAAACTYNQYSRASTHEDYVCFLWQHFLPADRKHQSQRDTAHSYLSCVDIEPEYPVQKKHTNDQGEDYLMDKQIPLGNRNYLYRLQYQTFYTTPLFPIPSATSPLFLSDYILPPYRPV